MLIKGKEEAYIYICHTRLSSVAQDNIMTITRYKLRVFVQTYT
jgi:hypothetical protein